VNDISNLTDKQLQDWDRWDTTEGGAAFVKAIEDKVGMPMPIANMTGPEWVEARVRPLDEIKESLMAMPKLPDFTIDYGEMWQKLYDFLVARAQEEPMGKLHISVIIQKMEEIHGEAVRGQNTELLDSLAKLARGGIE